MIKSDGTKRTACMLLAILALLRQTRSAGADLQEASGSIVDAACSRPPDSCSVYAQKKYLAYRLGDILLYQELQHSCVGSYHLAKFPTSLAAAYLNATGVRVRRCGDMSLNATGVHKGDTAVKLTTVKEPSNLRLLLQLVSKQPAMPEQGFYQAT